MVPGEASTSGCSTPVALNTCHNASNSNGPTARRTHRGADRSRDRRTDAGTTASKSGGVRLGAEDFSGATDRPGGGGAWLMVMRAPRKAARMRGERRKPKGEGEEGRRGGDAEKQGRPGRVSTQGHSEPTHHDRPEDGRGIGRQEKRGVLNGRRAPGARRGGTGRDYATGATNTTTEGRATPYRRRGRAAGNAPEVAGRTSAAATTRGGSHSQQVDVTARSEQS